MFPLVFADAVLLCIWESLRFSDVQRVVWADAILDDTSFRAGRSIFTGKATAGRQHCDSTFRSEARNCTDLPRRSLGFYLLPP